MVIAHPFLIWKRSSPKSFTKSFTGPSDARAVETAAVIYAILTASTLPATAVTTA